MNLSSQPLPVRKLPVLRASLLVLLVVLIAGALTGCFPAATAAPTTPTQTIPPPPPPTETVAPPPTATNTLQPSATPTEVPPTATLAPTDTATPTQAPLAVVQDGVTAWCVSYRDPNPMGGTADTPGYARVAKVVNGKLRLNVSRGSCTFVFAFNQPVPAGAELQVSDSTGAKWTKAALNPAGSDPKRGFAVLTSQSLNDSAYWEVTYPFSLVASDGTILWKDNVVVFKTFPGLCWEGSTPDPVTLFCPLSDTDFIPHYTKTP